MMKAITGGYQNEQSNHLCKSKRWGRKDYFRCKYWDWSFETWKKVLVIDNDPQGSLTEALGYPELDKLEITLATIMEWVLNEEEFDLEAGILHYEEGIDLLPANIELFGVETSLIGIMSSESMERKKAHYLRDIIREEELMKYASKAGVTSFQKSVVKTYMKGINESQLAAKYDVTTNAIHEAIY